MAKPTLKIIQILMIATNLIFGIHFISKWYYNDEIIWLVFAIVQLVLIGCFMYYLLQNDNVYNDKNTKLQNTLMIVILVILSLSSNVLPIIIQTMIIQKKENILESNENITDDINIGRRSQNVDANTIMRQRNFDTAGLNIDEDNQDIDEPLQQSSETGKSASAKTQIIHEDIVQNEPWSAPTKPKQSELAPTEPKKSELAPIEPQLGDIKNITPPANESELVPKEKPSADEKINNIINWKYLWMQSEFNKLKNTNIFNANHYKEFWNELWTEYDKKPYKLTDAGSLRIETAKTSKTDFTDDKLRNIYVNALIAIYQINNNNIESFFSFLAKNYNYDKVRKLAEKAETLIKTANNKKKWNDDIKTDYNWFSNLNISDENHKKIWEKIPHHYFSTWLKHWYDPEQLLATTLSNGFKEYDKNGNENVIFKVIFVKNEQDWFSKNPPKDHEVIFLQNEHNWFKDNPNAEKLTFYKKWLKWRLLAGSKTSLKAVYQTLIKNGNMNIKI